MPSIIEEQSKETKLGIELDERKVAQESKLRRLEAKAKMYDLLKEKAQTATNLVGIFHPVFRAKTKVMLTSADVQQNYYQKQASIAQEELDFVNEQIKKLQENPQDITISSVRKKRAIQGSKVVIKGGVINFSSSRNKRLTENLFDGKGRMTENFRRLTQLCVDYPRSTATLPKQVLKEIRYHATEILLIMEIYKNFAKVKKASAVQAEKPVDAQAQKVKALEDTSGIGVSGSTAVKPQ